MSKLKRKGKIRLGMLRCDTHGYYFGLFMQKFNPALLMKHNKIVHYYGTDWYDPANCINPQIRILKSPHAMTTISQPLKCSAKHSSASQPFARTLTKWQRKSTPFSSVIVTAVGAIT